MPKIAELMAVPGADHDPDWLADALKAAVQLEFATLPPYLTARWSIKDSNDGVVKAIQSITADEMKHMAWAANMLTAIGGTLEMNTADFVPEYPGPLPGGVNPEFTVNLRGLSPAALEEFKAIEFPEGGPIVIEAGLDMFSTIGEFYTAISDAFTQLAPSIDENRQLSVRGSFEVDPFVSLAQITETIALIKAEGEGSKVLPTDPEGDLAHYYRFEEILVGKKIEIVNGTPTFDASQPIPMPEAWPMAPVPEGGYKKDNVTPEVWAKIQEFDTNYTTMLDQLHAAWSELGQAGQASLSRAIGTMFSLYGPAIDLMQIPVPGGEGNYGPHWRLTR